MLFRSWATHIRWLQPSIRIGNITVTGTDCIALYSSIHRMLGTLKDRIQLQEEPKIYNDARMETQASSEKDTVVRLYNVCHSEAER